MSAIIAGRILVPSSALTLAERARGARAAKAARQRAAHEARELDAFERNRESLRAGVLEALDLVVQDEQIHRDGAAASTIVDGIRLGFDDEGDLAVGLPCAAGCGAPVWRAIAGRFDETPIEALGRLLGEEDERHVDCRQPAPAPTPEPDPVAEVEAAGRALADAERAEGAHAMMRAELLANLTASFVGTTNPLTKKEHSATSAKEAAEQTEEYRQTRAEARDLEQATTLARVAYEAARLRAWRAVGGAR